MEGYQIGKDIVALNLVVTQHTNDIKILTQVLQETRDVLNQLCGYGGLEYNPETKKWKRVEITLMKE